jgi:hypothetical protein
MRPFAEQLAAFVPLITGGEPAAEPSIDPRDFAFFLPHGMGLAAPMVVRPWDGLDALAGRGSYYGFDTRTGDPIKDAPSTEPTGGVAYFDEDITAADFETLMAVFGARTRETSYFVACGSSSNPPEDHYLDQIRTMSPSALALFRFKVDPRPAWPGTPLSIGELAHLFLKLQRERWSRSDLRGTLGGDDDWAKERLSFGFMVENASFAMYRFWSRPWLITK